MPFPHEWHAKLGQFYIGIAKQTATEMQQGTRPLFVGKLPLPHRLYVWLNGYFIRTGNIFAWCYLTLAWASMARTNNVADIKLQHLRPEEDSLGLCVPTNKTDKFGLRANMFWHIYANPEDVKQCALTALAAFLSLDELHPDSDDRVFVGGSQADRFANDMEMALATEEATQLMLEMGRAPKSIAPHSSRKGAATYASAMGAPYTAVSLRAGWSIGQIQQRYIGPGDAMDTFLGRILAGLDPNSPQFALLPPHLKPGIVEDSIFIRCFPGFKQRTPLLGVLRRILPSLLYHRRTLLEMLPLKHPLRSTVLFTDPALRQFLERQLVTGSESEHMKALGIPIQVNILKELRPPEPARPLPITPPRPQMQRTANGFPIHFEFPLVGGRAAWRLLVRGNRSEGIPPFRLIQSSDFSKNRDLGRRIGDWKYYYQRVVQAIGPERLDEDTLQRLENADDEVELNELFDVAWTAFGFAVATEGTTRTARVQDLKLNTIVQKLRQQGKPPSQTTQKKKRQVVVENAPREVPVLLFQQPHKKTEAATELLHPKRRAPTTTAGEDSAAKMQRLEDGSRKKTVKVDYTLFLL